MRGGFVVLFAGAAIAFHSAAASSLFSLGAPISQPSAGLRFRVFRSMKPLPLPAIRAERRSDGAKLIRNRDYWLFHQTAGLWSGDGGSVQIGVVLYPPIAKSEFKTDRELSAEFQSPEQPLSAEQLKTWVRDFTQAA